MNPEDETTTRLSRSVFSSRNRKELTMNEAKLALAVHRSTALMNYYSAERRAGADPLLACERMGEFAKRLDQTQLDYARDLEIIKQCMERS